MATGTRIPTITWTFGKRLEAARKLAGISQDQMAVELTKRGLKKGHAAINRWEHDQTQPRDLFAVVAAWSEITDVDERWLMKGDEWTSESMKPGSSTPSNRSGPGRKTRGGRGPAHIGTLPTRADLDELIDDLEAA